MTRARSAAPLGVLLVLAVAVRTSPWWFPNTLFGVMEYDDGVYYAASKLVLHCVLPYSDFTIVHPPVLALALLPAAAFGALFGDPAGMAAARVEMQVVAMLNVVLIYLLARRLPAAPELARRAALVAAGLYAVMPNAVIAEHTALLEPLVNLACLSGAYALLRKDPPSRKAALAAGFLVAAAIGIKLFACVYVVGLVAWMVTSRQRRLVLPLFAGLAAGAAVLVLPFALSSPATAWHDVVMTQLSRPKNTKVVAGLDRVVSMLGLGYATVVIGLLLLLVVLVATVASLRREPCSPLTLWFVVLLLAGVAFATSPSYFPHYGAFLAPPLVLLASRLAATRSPARSVALAGVVVAFLIGVGADIAHQQGQANLRDAAAVVPDGSCVYYDAVSLALAADVYADPSTDCPGWIDGRGVALTWNTDWPKDKDYYPAGLVADKRWQAENVGQMQRAGFLLLRSPPATFPEWDPQTRRYVLDHFAPVWVKQGRRHSELWKRTLPG